MIYKHPQITPSEWQAAGILLFSACAQSAQVYFNEFLASNSYTIQDEDLSGYSLSDDFGTLGKWNIPPGTTIPEKGFLLLWQIPSASPNLTTISAGSTHLFWGKSFSNMDKY